jgi:hypothetical protein
MGYFDQIMVSNPTANGLFELDIGKQEFTTSHFDTKQRTIQRIRCAIPPPKWIQRPFSGLYLFD